MTSPKVVQTGEFIFIKFVKNKENELDQLP